MNSISNNSPKTERTIRSLLTARRIILLACMLIAVGYGLMAGPGSTEQSFCREIFSTRRIVVAPALCLSGYLLIIVGILRRRR